MPSGPEAGCQPSGRRMTRECLDRRDRMPIYRTEYARVKTDKREILLPPESASGLSSSPAPHDETRRALNWRCGEILCGDDTGSCGIGTAYGCRKGDSSLRKGGADGLGPCGGGSRTSHRVPRWVGPQASPSLGGSCGSAGMRHDFFAEEE